MKLSGVYSLVVIHIGEPSRSKKWRLQRFGGKKSIMLPDGCQELDVCGVIPGVTIPSSRSGSRDDRLTKFYPMPLENVISFAGVDCLLGRRKRNSRILNFSPFTEEPPLLW